MQRYRALPNTFFFEIGDAQLETGVSKFANIDLDTAHLRVYRYKTFGKIIFCPETLSYHTAVRP